MKWIRVNHTNWTYDKENKTFTEYVKLHEYRINVKHIESIEPIKGRTRALDGLTPTRLVTASGRNIEVYQTVEEIEWQL